MLHVMICSAKLLLSTKEPFDQVATMLELSIFVLVVSEKCATLKCPWPQRCIVDNQGKAACSCINGCHLRKSKLLLGPVCANDNSEYNNRCEMENQKCSKLKNLVVLHYGPCKRLSKDTGMNSLIIVAYM